MTQRDWKYYAFLQPLGDKAWCNAYRTHWYWDSKCGYPPSKSKLDTDIPIQSNYPLHLSTFICLLLNPFIWTSFYGCSSAHFKQL